MSEYTSVGRSVAAAGMSPGFGALLDRRPRIYIAGPMTGLPEFNYPAFNAEADRLEDLGYLVENPADTAEQDDWTAYMRHAIAKMMRCDEVALLPGWSRSRGAYMEYRIAKRLGMRCRRCEQIIERPQDAYAAG